MLDTERIIRNYKKLEGNKIEKSEILPTGFRAQSVVSIIKWTIQDIFGEKSGHGSMNKTMGSQP